jgi:carbon starvation protein
MGIALYKFKWPLGISTAIFIPLIFGAIWLGQKIPLSFPGDALTQQRTWDVVILVYCFIASIIPVWVLLQSRGYLGGFILYATFAVGVLGLLFGKHAVEFPAHIALLPNGGPPLFPLLFTTIACGACSGFHGLVSSGTTSKQLARETDARTVGYGGMLLEGFVAVVAMSTLMMQAKGSAELGLGPDEIYARGLAHFMEPLGLSFAAGVTFGKLAFATFIYDTLDVATRLGRYILEELMGLRGRRGALLATLLTLAVPLVCIFSRFEGPNGQPLPLWKIFWPAFGASNQLLAALSLAGVTVWLKANGRNWWITAIPAVFMTVITYLSLFLIIKRAFGAGHGPDPVGITGVILLCLATYILARSGRAFTKAVA